MNVSGFVKSRTGVAFVVALFGAAATLVAARVVPTFAKDLSFGFLDPAASHAPLPPGVVPVWSTCPDFSAPDYFFPTGTFARDELGREWYGPVLQSMREEPLWCGARADESYRFLLVQSRHGPIGVRVERSGATLRLRAAYLISPEGGSIAELTDIVLQKNEWDALTGLLLEAHFWEIPTTKDGLGLDGQAWIFEGRKNGRYRVVERYSPDETLAQTGIRFLELAKMRTLAAEI